MKKLLGLIFALSTTLYAHAQLGIYGVVTNATNVILYLHGPSNQVCLVEGLNPANQAWQTLGAEPLDNYGYGQFNTALWNGCYGVYRAKTTNIPGYYSTNAFGVVAGWLPGGWTMIGNPFWARNISVIIPEPVEDTTVYRWNNASNKYDCATFSFGEWDQPLNVGMFEGILVVAPTNTWQRFLFSGLFDTNTITTVIPPGQSILCSPLWETDSSTWLVDLLTTNNLGGNSLLPVQTSGTNTQCTINRMIDMQGHFQTYTLGTNNVWQTNGVPTTVPLHLSEGFWLNKPTNATWTVRRRIW
jgi:hypothetical protein